MLMSDYDSWDQSERVPGENLPAFVDRDQTRIHLGNIVYAGFVLMRVLPGHFALSSVYDAHLSRFTSIKDPMLAEGSHCPKELSDLDVESFSIVVDVNEGQMLFAGSCYSGLIHS